MFWKLMSLYGVSCWSHQPIGLSTCRWACPKCSNISPQKIQVGLKRCPWVKFVARRTCAGVTFFHSRWPSGPPYINTSLIVTTVTSWNGLAPEPLCRCSELQLIQMSSFTWSLGNQILVNWTANLYSCLILKCTIFKSALYCIKLYLYWMHFFYCFVEFFCFSLKLFSGQVFQINIC